MNFHPRFALAFLILGATALFLHAHLREEESVSRMPFASLPQKLGDWTGADQPIPAESLEVLGAGDFLSREYRDSSDRIPPIDLFLAYIPSQRFGDTLHSPKHCLPGSGWQSLESRAVTLSLPGHDAFPANRSVIAKGADRRVALYWYWAHDRGVASEYWARFYLFTDSIRMNRSDGALVRIITPVRGDESVSAAEQRLVSFAANIVPAINRYVPR